MVTVLRALINQATPAPWERVGLWVQADDRCRVVADVTGAHSDKGAVADAALIAAAPSVADLLDRAMEQLAAANDPYRWNEFLDMDTEALLAEFDVLCAQLTKEA